MLDVTLHMGYWDRALSVTFSDRRHQGLAQSHPDSDPYSGGMWWLFTRG